MSSVLDVWTDDGPHAWPQTLFHPHPLNHRFGCLVSLISHNPAAFLVVCRAGPCHFLRSGACMYEKMVVVRVVHDDGGELSRCVGTLCRDEGVEMEREGSARR